MSTRSNNIGEAKPLLPLISVPLYGAMFAIWPFLLAALMARNPQQETPPEHKTAGETPKLDDSFTYFHRKMKRMMQFMRMLCATQKGLKGNYSKARFMRGRSLWPTYNKQRRALPLQLLVWSKTVPGNLMQWQKPTKPNRAVAWFSVVTSDMPSLPANLLTLVYNKNLW